MEMLNVVPFMCWGDERPEWVQGKESTIPKRTKAFVLINKAFCWHILYCHYLKNLPFLMSFENILLC